MRPQHSLRRATVILLLMITALMMLVAPTAQAATISDVYSSSNINFYDWCEAAMTSTDTTPNATATAVPASNNAEKIFRFLISTNFKGNDNKPLNAVQAAAILGNIQQESAFNPKATNPSGYKGIVQWSTGRYAKIAEPRDNLDNQMKHIVTEMDSSSYKSVLTDLWNAKTEDKLAAATFAVVRHYEVAIEGNFSNVTTYTNDNEAEAVTQHWAQRKQYAQALYQKYKHLVSGSSSSSCSNGGGGGDGDIVGTATRLAWPLSKGVKNNDGTAAKPEYAAALTKHLSKINKSAPHCPAAGQGQGRVCAMFVAVVMWESGVDPDYGKGQSICVVSGEEAYMDAHPEKYKAFKFTNTSQLKPGDIVTRPGYFTKDKIRVEYAHILFYIGDGKLADASLAERTAAIKTVWFTFGNIYRYIGGGNN